ncbi:MAG: HepT-like ribonuclease domain-containing protein [Methanospirillum sp.]
MRPDRDRLADILEAIEKIRERLPPAPEELMASELLQVWVVHHLQVIGEAANNLSPAFIAAHPEIPWRRIIGLRHALVHQYFGVDLDAIWSVAIDDLPPLAAAVAAILDGLP